MAIPDYQTIMLPLLRLAADGGEHSVRDAIEQLAEGFGLTEEARLKGRRTALVRMASVAGMTAVLAAHRVGFPDESLSDESLLLVTGLLPMRLSSPIA